MSKKISLRKEQLKSGDYFEDSSGKLIRKKFDGKDHLLAQQKYRASVTVDKKKKAKKNACRTKTSSSNDW